MDPSGPNLQILRPQAALIWHKLHSLSFGSTPSSCSRTPFHDRVRKGSLPVLPGMPLPDLHCASLTNSCPESFLKNLHGPCGPTALQLLFQDTSPWPCKERLPLSPRAPLLDPPTPSPADGDVSPARSLALHPSVHAVDNSPHSRLTEGIYRRPAPCQFQLGIGQSSHIHPCHSSSQLCPFSRTFSLETGEASKSWGTC